MKLRYATAAALVPILVLVVPVVGPAAAQSPQEKCANESKDTQQQCLDNYRQQQEQNEEWERRKPGESASVSPQPPRVPQQPQPQPQTVDLRPLVREACGRIVPPPPRA